MRPRKRPAPGNQDLLLQTFTNVVGVLIVLLALVQMRADGTVSPTPQQSQTATSDELARLTQQLEAEQREIERRKHEVELAETLVPESRRKLEANRKEIAALRSQVSPAVVGDEDPEILALRVKVNEERKRVDEFTTRTKQLQGQITAIEARLETTSPPAPAPAPRSVTPPNPRSAPPNAEVVQFVCRYGRVASLNEDALRRIAQQRIDRAVKDLRRDDGIDCEALEALFENEDIGNIFFRLKISRQDRKPKLIVEQRPNAGDTIETVGNPKSLYQTIVKNLDTRRNWIRFRVYPDSFETYLAARDALKSRKVPAGWQPALETTPHEIDLKLQADLSCSPQTVAGPLTAEPDALAPKLPVELPFRNRVKTALEKKNSPKDSMVTKAPNASQPEGSTKDPRNGQLNGNPPKKQQVEVLKPQPKTELPAPIERQPPPNDDID